MTRNNLDQQLSWLLGSKPSIPPNSHSLPPASTSASLSQPAAPPTQRHRAEPVSRPTATTQAPPRAVTPAQEMAKLRTAPGSAVRRQPGLLNGVTAGNATRTRQDVDITFERPMSPSRPFQTPTSHLSRHADIESIDLSNDSTISPQRPKQPPSSSRKRRSEEHELALSREHVRSASTRAKTPKTQAKSTAPEEFTNIDDLVADMPTEPPPPCSAFATKSVKATNQPTASRLPSPVSVQAQEDFDMADFEVDDDDIINFSNPPAKRTATERKPSSAKENFIADTVMQDSPSRRQRSTKVTFEEALSNRSTSTVQAAGNDVAGSGAPHVAATRVTTSGSFTAPTSETRSVTHAASASQHNINGDQALFKRFVESSDKQIQSLIDGIAAKRDHLADLAAERFDEFDDMEELEDKTNMLHVCLDTIEALKRQRQDHIALQTERNAMRSAISSAMKARSGVEEAKAGHQACKEKILALENQSVAAVQLCREELETFFQSTEDIDEDPTNKSIAVRSTQDPPSRHHESAAMVPSSSRIMQTQMPDAFTHGTAQGCNRTLANDYRLRSDQQVVFANPQSPRAQISVSQGRHFSKPIELDFDDPPTSTNVFHPRHHRRDRQPNDDQEEDFGMEEDDDLMHFADNFESNQQGVQNSRPVLAETSGNSQSKPVSAMKPKRKRASQTVPEEDDRSFNHPWSQEVFSVLRKRFKMKGFRQCQLDAINATLAGNDTFVLVPTGGGKSLCYQLPALVKSGKTRGVTVVITPLLSLMLDQINHLRALGVNAVLVNGETPEDERKATYNALMDPHVEDFVQLLYITPEMLSKSARCVDHLKMLYNRNKFARLVIDEAHCVSQWGHDFRPDYKLIGDARRQFSRVPVMALTATATENVKADIIHNLDIKGCEVFKRSFNRVNLHYSVLPKPKGGKNREDVQAIAELINEHHDGESGIIYCLARQTCEEVAKILSERYHISAHHYHAGVDGPQKLDIQKKWQANKYSVIVATIAFGMGIDKPDVRYVIHHTIPKSVEGYYQETGRAGRDGLPSQCYLFYAFSDVCKLKRMIDDTKKDKEKDYTISPEQKERLHQMLRTMANFCSNRSDCRRLQILAYFSERFDASKCGGNCDNCESGLTFRKKDFTSHARQVIGMVQELVEKERGVTLPHCIDVFRGSKAKKIIEKEDNKLGAWGQGRELDPEDSERLFHLLMFEGALSVDVQINKAGFPTSYVILGPHYRMFETGGRRLEMPVRTDIDAQEIGKGKIKTIGTKKRTKPGREPAALPLSTNVSSPVQAPSKRTRNQPTTSRVFHPNGFLRDDFVVPDDEKDENYSSNSDDESDGFAPIRQGPSRGKSTPTGRNRGQPIITDHVLNNLDDMHKTFVEGFTAEAKKLCKELMKKHNWTIQPFSDGVLRTMAVDWVDNKQRLLDIEGVNAEIVEICGEKILSLLRRTLKTFKAQGGEVDGPENDLAKHVIEITSDDEDYGTDICPSDVDAPRGEADQYGDDDDEEDEDEEEASPHWNAATQAFFAKHKLSQDQGMHFKEGRAPKAAKTYGNRSRAGGSGKGWKGKSKFNARRKGSGGSRASYGSKANASAAPKQTGFRASRISANTSRSAGGGGGGISAMPT